jgi:hypothetical protein
VRGRKATCRSVPTVVGTVIFTTLMAAAAPLLAVAADAVVLGSITVEVSTGMSNTVVCYMQAYEAVCVLCGVWGVGRAAAAAPEPTMAAMASLTNIRAVPCWGRELRFTWICLLLHDC